MLVFLIALLLHVPTKPAKLPTAATTLRVDIQNIRRTQGTVHIALYRPCDDFPNCKPVDAKKVQVAGKTVEAAFSVEPGDYAVAVYHDENSNGVMDKRIFGIPKEPYGFSNNFKPVMSAPKFKDCQIQVGSSGKNISIKLI